MTDKHRFAGDTERWAGELWNVTLLPIVHAEGTSVLENLGETRRRDAINGASTLRPRPESISASFEGQLKAVGW